MVRKLKFHEQKLLKRHTNFVSPWQADDSLRQNKILKRYHISKREDYVKYHKLSGMITKLAHQLKQLPPDDEFRNKMTDQLLEKLYAMALIETKGSLHQAAALTPSAFCRRRLSTILVKNKYCEHMKQAVTYVEQEHIRVGPNVVSDPAFLITRTMEDFVTWTDSSKIKKKVMQYNNALDDYDFLES